MRKKTKKVLVWVSIILVLAAAAFFFSTQQTYFGGYIPLTVDYYCSTALRPQPACITQPLYAPLDTTFIFQGTDIAVTSPYNGHLEQQSGTGFHVYLDPKNPKSGASITNSYSADSQIHLGSSSADPGYFASWANYIQTEFTLTNQSIVGDYTLSAPQSTSGGQVAGISITLDGTEILSDTALAQGTTSQAFQLNVTGTHDIVIQVFNVPGAKGTAASTADFSFAPLPVIAAIPAPSSNPPTVDAKNVTINATIILTPPASPSPSQSQSGGNPAPGQQTQQQPANYLPYFALLAIALFIAVIVLYLRRRK